VKTLGIRVVCQDLCGQLDFLGDDAILSAPICDVFSVAGCPLPRQMQSTKQPTRSQRRHGFIKLKPENSPLG